MSVPLSVFIKRNRKIDRQKESTKLIASCEHSDVLLCYTINRHPRILIVLKKCLNNQFPKKRKHTYTVGTYSPGKLSVV